MFKSKSFDLVNEEKTKKPERLYQPRRMRWLKYIILPAVFSFALLLILVNVDFSDNNEEESLLGWDKSFYVSSQGFENNTLRKNFFSRSFGLRNVTIENCTIIHISDGTFDQNSTRYLMSLQLINVQLENLTESALQGLQNLHSFTLLNENSYFKPFGFLSAVSKTIINARIHPSFSTEIKFAVSDFLGSQTFTQLKLLDMSGTNLGENLGADSFENLPALEQLILKDCGLSQLEWDNLPPRLQLLQYLDLSESRKSYQLELFEITAETTIDDEQNPTIQPKEARGPSFAPSTTNSTTTPTTQGLTVTTALTTATIFTEETVIEELDESSTTPRSNCEEVYCEELVCSRISAESMIGSVDLESSDSCKDGILVEICESDCTTPTYFCGQLGVNFTTACCSQDTMRCVVPTKVSWFEDHSGLVIGLGIGLLFVGTFLGILIAYATMRLKPSLFSGSKRRESNTMGLIPRRFEKDMNDYAVGQISTLDDNEYVTAYHRYLEQANHRQSESNKYIYPPRDRAPSVPPSCNYPLPLPLPARNNYIYESCELYEELP
ncbi:uncharacterized protein [Drosophila takahashii]|uniref:uncharacterized protein n=1 Tax=Drosophila takahashii TaxID=29030 RepID=UPI001CF83A65|nr:uncharacterized protein LOC108066079 [Drosophila takahashii]